MKVSEEVFQVLLNDRLEKIKNTLAIKAKEYVRDEDRLHNFNVGANITGQTREEILHGFLLKHIISYFDIIEDIKNDIYPSNKLVDEKIGDIINYLILFEISVKTNIMPGKWYANEWFDFLSKSASPNGTTYNRSDTIGTL